MKKNLFLAILILLTHLFANAQNRKDLVGTWYGKIRTYPFKQDGNVQCYTKRMITGWQQQLKIDKNLIYVYTEYYRGDTTRTRGYVDVNSNTLKFVVTQTNQPKSHNALESSYFLYLLNNSDLIYSNFPIRKIIKEEDQEDKIFTRVEVKAEYSLGKEEFLKILYASLATQGVNNKDSVSWNSYKVKIDSIGNINLATLQSGLADPRYFSAIKQALLNLQSNFKPAMQNGRAISAYMHINIIY